MLLELVFDSMLLFLRVAMTQQINTEVYNDLIVDIFSVGLGGMFWCPVRHHVISIGVSVFSYHESRASNFLLTRKWKMKLL